MSQSMRRDGNYRESWLVTNLTKKTFVIGDLGHTVPEFKPGETVDILRFISREKASHSKDIVALKKAGWIKLVKKCPYENDTAVSTSDIEKSIAPATREEIGEYSGGGSSGPIAASDITSGTFDDARIAESNITQHESVLTITESQISDLDKYTQSEVDSLVVKEMIIGFAVDGQGDVISTGSKGFRSIPFDSNIIEWTIIADQSGSCVIDIKSTTYANYPTSLTIAGEDKPSLSNAIRNQTNDLSSWSASLSEGDILEFIVDSAATVEKIWFFLKIQSA